MGEVADDMINGRCCSLCGQYFQHPKKQDRIFEHGFPVYCSDCWEPDCGHERAVVDTL